MADQIRIPAATQVTTQEEDDLLRQIVAEEEGRDVTYAAPTITENREITGLPLSERLRIKMLSSEDDPKALSRLRGTYQGHEFAVKGSQIIGRKKGEEKWGYLDPPQLEATDIVEIAPDVVGGIAEGAAGVGGLALGGPVGSAVAGGATAAVIDALKQRLAQGAGVQGEYRPLQTALAGGVGALGAGGPELLRRKVLPAFYGAVSGVSKEALQTFADRPAKILAMEADAGARTAAEHTQERLFQPVFLKLEEKGAKIADAIDGAGGTVDVTPIGTSVGNFIAKIKSRSSGPVAPSVASAASKAEEEILSMLPSGAKLTAREAHDLSRMLADKLDLFARSKSPTGTEYVGGFGPFRSEARLLMSDMKRTLDSGIEKAAEGAGIARQEYGDIAGLRRRLSRYFGTPERTETSLRGLGSRARHGARAVVAEAEQKLGVKGLAKEAQTWRAYSELSEPRLGGTVLDTLADLPKSNKGITATLRGASALGVGSGVGKGLEALGMPPIVTWPAAGAAGLAWGRATSPWAARRAILGATRAQKAVERITGAGWAPLLTAPAAKLLSEIPAGELYDRLKAYLSGAPATQKDQEDDLMKQILEEEK